MIALTVQGFADDTPRARSSLPTEPVPIPLLVERFPVVHATEALDDTGVQQLARELGTGQFYVRVDCLDEKHPEAGGRVIFVFASPETMSRQAPMKRIFQSGTPGAENNLRVAADDNELVTAIYSAHYAENASDADLSRSLPRTLSTALYGGRATFDAAGALLSSRDARGARLWKGCFALENGGLEEVTAALPAERNGGVEVQRKLLRSPADSVAGTVDLTGTETWLVASRAGWHPSQRFQLRIALAAMRHDPRSSYLLGAALWQEKEDPAHIEAVKWLKTAAAGGSRDAANLLAAISRNSIRATRNREIERKEQ